MSESFKVAIVGGGLAGLSTALHLEKLGIEWILIEAHDVIAPEMGASIGLAPNGMAILDQLGCLEDVERRSVACQSVKIHNGEGQLLSSFPLAPIRKIHGYDLAFTERRIILEILHDHIKGKDNIFTGQKVQRIEHVGDGVEIHTREGRTFTADIVVGADGIHSPVRGLMWKSALDDGSTAFDKNIGKDVATEYGCIFGLSAPTNDLKEGEVLHCHTYERMVGAVVGQDDVVYWFHFFKLPEKHLGLDLPRLSEDDVDRMLAEDGHRSLKAGTTFNDIFKNKKTHIITPLPTHMFERWHYKRIICLGDSMAKFQVIQGQGGCSVLETSAAFVDQLHDALKANGMKKLSAEQVESAFTKTAEIRKPRTKKLVWEGLTLMRFASWSNFLFRFIDSYIVGLIPTNMLANLMFAGSVGAYVSTTLPSPNPSPDGPSTTKAETAKEQAVIQEVPVSAAS